MMSVREIFGSAREACRYTREKFNRLVTVRDINSPRRKFRLMDDHNDEVRVKDIVQTRYPTATETRRCSAVCLFRAG